jgi:hypothetical protein
MRGEEDGITKFSAQLSNSGLPGVEVRQQMPIKNDRPAIQDLVIADIEARKAVGFERYGTLLQPFNGRDALMDAYQEALDLCQYLRQAIEERNAGGDRRADSARD